MMDFRIADTFTDSLAKLSGEEQKAVKKKWSRKSEQRYKWKLWV